MTAHMAGHDPAEAVTQAVATALESVASDIILRLGLDMVARLDPGRPRRLGDDLGAYLRRWVGNALT